MLHLDIGYVPPTAIYSLCLPVGLTRTAVGLFQSPVRRSETYCQMNAKIQRVILTVSNYFSQQSFSVSISVTSALKVNLRICAIETYILFTYLLTLFTRFVVNLFLWTVTLTVGLLNRTSRIVVTFSVQTTKSLASPSHLSDACVCAITARSGWLRRSAVTQCLWRDLTPRPHVSEHSDHAVHSDQTHSRRSVLCNSTASAFSCHRNAHIFYEFLLYLPCV